MRWGSDVTIELNIVPRCMIRDLPKGWNWCDAKVATINDKHHIVHGIKLRATSIEQIPESLNNISKNGFLYQIRRINTSLKSKSDEYNEVGYIADVIPISK